MRTVQRRWRAILVQGLVLGVCWAVAARAHIDLDPRQSIPKKWQMYTMTVPTETEASTVRLRLSVPAEFEVEVIEHNRLWQIATLRDDRGQIREISWDGNSIPAQRFETFSFLARNPAAVGIYRWKIEQHYRQGKPSAWEAQTQIVALEKMAGQRTEEAWRTAQVATTVSLVALGMAVTLSIVTIIGIVQHGRRSSEDDAA